MVVKDNLFLNMGSDGIDGGPGTIINNEFYDAPGTTNNNDPRHTDFIQYGKRNTIIKGNFFHGECIQGVGAFDGIGPGVVIQDNVITGCNPHSLVAAGDGNAPGTLIDHNTVVGDSGSRPLFECGSKTGDPVSTPRFTNNISQDGIDSSGTPCNPELNTHNLFGLGKSLTSFNGTGNISGTPCFVGVSSCGQIPTTWAGFALKADSPGKGAAADGSDAGARVNLYSPGNFMQTNNCMPDPSACGYPDRETVGVQSGHTLTTVNGNVILSTPGEVYQDKLIVNGTISVRAQNVTIRNVKIVAPPNAGVLNVIEPGTSSDRFGTYPWNLTIDHVEIDGNQNYELRMVAYTGYTLTNSYLHNGSDCAFLDTNVTIRDNLCASGPDSNDDGWPDGSFPNNPANGPAWCNDGTIGAAHLDGFQSDGGNNSIIDHNVIRNPCIQTSAIIMCNAGQDCENNQITRNLMAGGGYVVYCSDPPPSVGEVFTGNRIARTFFPNGGYWSGGPLAHCENWSPSGNVWDDTGTLLDGQSTNPTPPPNPPPPNPTPPGNIDIGENTITSTDDSGNANLLLAQRANLAQSASIQSLSFYVTTASGKLRLGIYDATGPTGGPGTKLAETAEITPTVGWNTTTTTTHPTLAAGNYWLAYTANDNNLSFKKSTNSSVNSVLYNFTYNTMPNTFPTVCNVPSSSCSTPSHWSLYATLSTSVGPKPADINQDGSVNITDLSLLLSSYGQTTTNCITNNTYVCDIKNDTPPSTVGHIDIFDLSLLLSGYGT
jgi:hypothetical protein